MADILLKMAIIIIINNLFNPDFLYLCYLNSKGNAFKHYNFK